MGLEQPLEVKDRVLGREAGCDARQLGRRLGCHGGDRRSRGRWCGGSSRRAHRQDERTHHSVETILDQPGILQTIGTCV